MSLSKRLYEAQKKKDAKTVADWNKRLQAEIAKKEAEKHNDSLS